MALFYELEKSWKRVYYFALHLLHYVYVFTLHLYKLHKSLELVINENKLISRLDVLMLTNTISASSPFLTKNRGYYTNLVVDVIHVNLCHRC